jgi:hypothetical protein
MLIGDLPESNPKFPTAGSATGENGLAERTVFEQRRWARLAKPAANSVENTSSRETFFMKRRDDPQWNYK